ncbi:MAG: peptidoglycan DD-metalloendopeptidase family protein [Parvularculaceae bacterium]|nr:peptidoglycan DD-metalloendopeptidase family protein [Parvularculaceae bacterium]
MTILSLPLLLLSLQDIPPAEAARLEALERQIEQREQSAAEIRGRTEEQEEGLDRLRSQIVSTASALQAAEARATELEGDLADIEVREAIALEERDARSLELSQVLAALQNLERSRPPALVVSPGDAQRAALAAISLSSMTPRLAEIVEARKAEIIRLAALREEKRRARAQLDDTNTALTERRRLLENLLSEREQVYNQDRAELVRVEREARRLAAEASNIRELLARLRDLPSPEDVLDRYRQSRRDRDLPATFAASKGQLDSPVAGIVAGYYGERDAQGNQRDSVELVTRPGAVVTTPYSGRVQWAAEFGALGNVLIIDVGGGFSAIMIGVDRFIVQKGQPLAAGEPVGVMSSAQSAARLQFQIRESGRPVDPSPWIETLGR